MKKNQKLIRLFAIISLFYAFTVSKVCAQLSISGEISVCVGVEVVYEPSIDNPAYIYTWTVDPLSLGNGVVLFGSYTGANIQWITAGTANVVLNISDPSSGGAVIHTANLLITIHEKPLPYITSEVWLGCQPIDWEPPSRNPTITTPTFDEVNCHLVCANSTVRYSGVGASTSTFTWSVVGAVSTSVVSSSEIDITWGTPGGGMITVTETTESGCSASNTICVEVIEKPKAQFIPIPFVAPEATIEICRYGEVFLVDASMGSPEAPIVSWLWDWGDGSYTSTSPGGMITPVTHQYNDPGGFTISLVVTNTCGCTDTFKMSVRVSESPAPVIACPRVVCPGERTKYTIDNPCNEHLWTVEGGTILGSDMSSVEIVWDAVNPAVGFGYVSYTTRCEPCPTTVTEAVPVVIPNAKIFGPDNVCLNEQYVYRMPKWPTTEFEWEVIPSGAADLQATDQRNEIAVTPLTTGSFTLQVRYKNTVLLCKGVSKMDITVKPQATIDGNATLCEGASGIYTISSGTANWTLYDATNTTIATGSSPSFPYTFSTPGNYRIAATSSTMCPPDDFFITVVANPPTPTLISGPDKACKGIPKRYEAGPVIPGTTFKWGATGGADVNVGIGGHTYIKFDDLPATVWAVRVTTDGNACESDTIFKTVYPEVPLVNISGPDTVCHSTYNEYSITYTEGDFYEWSVYPEYLGSVSVNGSNTADILWNIPYTLPGATAWLTLKVWKCGNMHRDTFEVFVLKSPVIDSIILESDTVCSNNEATFKVYTTPDITSSGGYTINWGDGVSTTGAILPPLTGGYYAFSHTYTTDGMSTPTFFTPSITIYDANGCVSNITAIVPTITVMPRPISWISPGGIGVFCDTEPWSQLLTATVTTGLGGTNTFLWTPGGETSTTKTVSTPGTYTVTVSNDVFGCTSTASVTIIEEPCEELLCTDPSPIITNVTKESLCDGTINITTILAGAPYTSATWSVPPGVTETSSTPTAVSAVADVAGAYTFHYHLEYGDECFLDSFITVIVPYIPDLRYGITCNQAAGKYNVELIDHSTQYAGAISTWTYTDDAYTPLGTGPGGITVLQDGGTTETYYLIIDDGPGGSPACTTSVVVNVPYFPTVSIAHTGGVNPGCEDDVIYSFEYDIAPLSPSGLSFLWDFGDLSSNASSANPINKVYGGDGTFTPSLAITDEYGCIATDTFFSITTTENKYKGDISASPVPACMGDPVTLSYVPILLAPPPPPYPLYYAWYMELEAIGYSTTSTYNVFYPGGYWVEGSDDFGCKVQSENMAIVDIIQVPQIAISGRTEQCVNQEFTLWVQDYGIDYTIEWFLVGSATPFATGTSVTQTISVPGTYTGYAVITHTASGCTYTSEDFTVTVHPPPATPIPSFDVLSCDPYLLELTATGVPGVYNWSNGMTGDVITTPHGGLYRVILTDENGCRVDTTILTPKDLREYLWVFPDGCFCNIQTQAPYIIGPIIPLDYWEWIKNSSADVTGSGLMPIYPVSSGNTYNMLLQNEYCTVVSETMYYQSDTCTGGIDSDYGEEYKPGNNGSYRNGNHLLLSPNPANTHLMADYTIIPGASERYIIITDATGRIVSKHRLDYDKGQLTLSLEQYHSGVYIVQLYRDGVMVGSSKLTVIK